MIKEFLALADIEQCLTLAYSNEENAIVERLNKETNRHLHALTFDNLSLGDYRTFLPFVQRFLNANRSDRLKISASQMLFGNMLDLDAGIFDKFPSRSASDKPFTKYLSNLLSILDNLLKASAKKMLRTDLFHLTTKNRTNTQNT